MITIAHFSDVHALSLRGVRAWEFASKRLPGFLNWQLNRKKHRLALFEALVEDLNQRPPDHVIVTGDLSNLSLGSELQLARSVLDRLSLGPAHVTVVPGNHDVYTWDAWLRRSFHRALRPYAEGDLPRPGEVAPGQGEHAWPIVRVRGELAVVGASTASPTPVPFASGALGRAQLHAIERALERLRGKFRVLALHHPPYRNRHSFLRGLRDRGALAEVLGRVGCELVLHGHEHRDLRRELSGPDGPIPIVGVGSATYDDPRPERRARYNVYHVDGGRLERVETRVHDGARFRS